MSLSLGWVVLQGLGERLEAEKQGGPWDETQDAKLAAPIELSTLGVLKSGGLIKGVPQRVEVKPVSISFRKGKRRKRTVDRDNEYLSSNQSGQMMETPTHNTLAQGKILDF